MIFINPYIFSKPLPYWYTVSAGNWSDPNIWAGAGKLVSAIPLATDDMTLLHGVVLNQSVSVNNITIGAGGVLKNEANGNLWTMTVNGILDSTAGLINFANSGFSSAVLALKKDGNLIPKANFAAGVCTVLYNKSGNQNILDLNYHNLTVDQSGIKTPVANLVTTGAVVGNFYPSTLELGNYNATIGGALNLGSMTFSKTGAGNLLFKGPVNVGYSTLSFTGNPNVEFQANVTLNEGTFISGTGTCTFSTKGALSFSTSIGNSSVPVMNGPVIIKGAITLYNEVNMTIGATGSITGDNANSTLRNRSLLTLKNSTQVMATGIFDRMSDANTIVYAFNGNFALPYTSYRSVSVTNSTGNKTLSGNTTVAEVFNCDSVNIDFGGYTFSVAGNFNVSAGTVTKSGPGLFSIGGLFNAGYCIIAFGGNPTLELKGGMVLNTMGAMNFGTGSLGFGFNAAKSITLNGVSGGISLTLNNPITVHGAVDFTLNDGVVVTLTQPVTGDNVLSKLVNKTTLKLQNAIAPMAIGLFDANVALNTVEYSLNGNQDIKGGTYRNLKLITGGVKKLLGAVSVVSTYTLTAPATVDSNGFALTNP